MNKRGERGVNVIVAEMRGCKMSKVDEKMYEDGREYR